MAVYMATLIAWIIFLLTKQDGDAPPSLKSSYRKGIHDFVFLVAIVGSAFSALQLVVLLLPSSASSALLTMEHSLIFLRAIARWLKIPVWIQIVAILMLFIAGFLSDRLSRWRFAGKLSKTNKIIGKANVILTLATSVTLFGVGTNSGIASKEEKLIWQIDKVTRGCEEVSKALDRVAVRVIIDQLIPSSSANDVMKNLSVAEISSSVAVHRIEDMSSDIPRYEELSSRPQNFGKAPTAYEIRNQFDYLEAEAKKEIESIHPIPDANNSKANQKTNDEILREAKKEIAGPQAKTFEVLVEEIVDLAFEGTSDELVSHLSSLSATEVPSKLTEMLLKKVALGPLKKFIATSVNGTLKDIYEKHIPPSVALTRLRLNLSSGIEADDVSELERTYVAVQSPASALRESAQKAEGTAKDDASQFAAEEAERIFAYSKELASSVNISRSPQIANAWKNILGRSPSVSSDPLKRLRQAWSVRAAAIALHDSVGSDISRHAIEFEHLRNGTVSIQSAYRQEEIAGLSHDYESQWGGYRRLFDKVVARNALKLTPAHLATVKSAVMGWEEYRKMQAEKAIEEGAASGELDGKTWDRTFAQYLTQNPDMAALWGFLVIDFEFSRDPNTRVLEKYIKARVEAEWANYGAMDHILESGTELNRSKKEFVRKALQHGPKPKDGYLYFMEQVGFQSQEAAETYFSSPRVRVYINDVCPEGQIEPDPTDLSTIEPNTLDSQFDTNVDSDFAKAVDRMLQSNRRPPPLPVKPN